MSNKINTIDLNSLDILNRTVDVTEQIQSIKTNPLDGSFLTCYPILDDGTIILYPQNPNNASYSETTFKTILNYGDLNFPLDTCWNNFNNRFWIADAGNSSVLYLSTIDNTFIKSISGFTLPHSIILNRNNRTVFVKSFTDRNTQKVTNLSRTGEILFEIEFPAFIYSTDIDYSTEYLNNIPKYFTMDFDAKFNRLWFCSLSTLYMLDLNNNQVIENDLTDGRIDNLSCVSIDRKSGNAFVIIDDNVNYYIKQIYRDNNLVLGTAYLEEQPLP